MSKDSCCSQPFGSALKTDNQWLKIAFVLVILTIIYNVAEALVAVFTGYAVESIALVGFGFDSLLEVSAALLMLWRLIEQVRYQSAEAVERAETIVHRFVGATFLLLAAYISYDAAITLWHQSKPEATSIGIFVASLSLVIMPLLTWGKILAAKHINSAALRAEAKETVACSILSAILLIGLGLNAIFGWWWADPVAALTMIPWLIIEGWAGLKGQGCCG
jgi:divalent metal cation (Fe/Co/Zn/Cd) transporter